ncbi:hypothetical protein AB1Y20_011450 [Prymnesium parvum]|uniref:EF-hand domain-containing protein n=1 Tax=Prymnesium parvum TaxID=97485 RepID=A0AB34IPK8_PRYPA
MSITPPPGVVSGQQFQFATPDGRIHQTTVPPHARPGCAFIVEVVPAPQQVPQAVAAPALTHAPPQPHALAQPAHAAAPPPSYFPTPYAAPPAVAVAPHCGGVGVEACASSMAGCSLGPSTMGSRPAGGGGSCQGEASAEPVVLMGLPVEEERPATPPADRTSAERHAECPICFAPLHSAPVGIFLDAAGKRVSQHFFNLEAAQSWIRSGNGLCPLTRRPVASVLPVPDIRTDPDGWFRAVDIDGDGKLSRREVVECLKAQLPIDNEALDKAVNDPTHWMWQQWDKDGSGHIERDELLQDQGLASYIRTAYHRSVMEVIPDIRNDKHAWFEYWDEDSSGSLEKDEVVRALLKTFKLTQDQDRVLRMRSDVDAIWPIFDSDGSGSIEKDEFLLPDEGFADMVLANLHLS